MDLGTAAALVTTLIIHICGDGTIVNGEACADGNPPRRIEYKASILKRDLDTKEDALFEFDVGNTHKFTLRPDGSMSSAPGFHVDDAALAFWIAVATTYRDACPSLSSVIDPLIEKSKPTESK